MKISYNWLQSYFKEPLPSPEKLAELFTFRFAEVESVEALSDDTILDVKILPDRAHYALCHRGIAGEVAAMTDNSVHIPDSMPHIAYDRKPLVAVENATLCTRYTARYIENVSVGQSPAWLADRLVAIGQRPINVIVDAANMVMFDMGQPLHAFDADKVNGAISVRMARAGEHITTLDSKEIKLTSDILVIADETGPLAIAGIKGGTRAQVDEQTKNIILESAHFDSPYVRIASNAIGIRTDASKRFENEITPEWALKGSDQCSALIGELCAGSRIGSVADYYPKKAVQQTISFDPSFASRVLGETSAHDDVIRILSSLGITAEKTGDILSLTIPYERIDLVVPEDIVEEIGRIYGYENIPPIAPPKIAHELAPLPSLYYQEKIRDALIRLGFSEIFTYSFAKTGVLEIEKSLASDKNFLRKDLVGNMSEAIERNSHYADLLGIDDMKLFEIGAIFDEAGEHTALAIGIRKTQKKKGNTYDVLFAEVQQALASIFGNAIVSQEKGNNEQIVWQIVIDDLIAGLPKPVVWDIRPYEQEHALYEKISAYPFMVRDISLFVPVETQEGEIATLINTEAGELLAKIRLFDIFTKTFPDGKQKTSYAFRLVFQSHEKTLSDEEANAIMERITAAITAKGWEVR